MKIKETSQKEEDKKTRNTLSILNNTVVALIFIVTMMNVVISAFVGGTGGPVSNFNATITEG